MKTPHTRGQQGFTLVELMVSIGLSAIVLMATLSLMGFTQGQWEQGAARQDMTSELTLTVEKIVRDVRAARMDSISVSSSGDTLYIQGGQRYYRNMSSNNLTYIRPNVNLSFLQDMITGFKAKKPCIDTNGDTLSSAIHVIVSLENEGLVDSARVIIVPRAR
jgi:prepilin-type N-terminal cleavage/methylation domain-containing protein